MVEISVAVADATGVHGLEKRLAGVFDPSALSVDGARREVSIRVESDSRGVLLVLDAVQAWLGEDGVRSAKLSIGERSFTMIGAAASTRGS